MYFSVNAQEIDQPDFQWGNALYFNVNIGESVIYKNTEIKLIQIQNNFNFIQIGTDSVWLKVSRRSLPEIVNGLRIFVADNKNVKAITDDHDTHGLLHKDALICISLFNQPLLDPMLYNFPVSFNDGFIWNTEDDKHLFSYLGLMDCNGEKKYCSHAGIDFELNDAKGLEKHWLLAIENSTVVWIEENRNENSKHQTAVLLKSNSNPGIYYYYSHLYDRTLEVRKGQNLRAGELIGTAWGDDKSGFVHFSVIKSDTIPANAPETFQIVNFFPQIYALYFRNTLQLAKTFVKGTIEFGRENRKNENDKNNLAFEEYTGKGWLLGKWNTADKVPTASSGDAGNVRLTKTLFAGTKAECSNPENRYVYEINVRKGTYRIRVKAGDLELATWQKVKFENTEPVIVNLGKGEFKWTSERIVKVNDGKLSIQIELNEDNNLPAGIIEIVFQNVN